MQFDQDTEEALRSLFTRPVFGRGWIIQEVALARSVEVCWGSGRLDLPILEAAFSKANDELYGIAHKYSATKDYLNLSSISSIRFQQQNDERMEPVELIERFLDFHFTDERDRIYGILALRLLANEQWPNSTFVQIDYTISKWDTFKSFTEACLVREGNLETLLYTHSWDTTLEDQLSWACDWTHPNTD